MCGALSGLSVLHLDQRAENTDPDNLTFACATHLAMFHGGLYPVPAVRLLREHWQATRGVPVTPTPEEPARGRRGPVRRVGLRRARA